MFSATFKGKDYQETITNSLQAIKDQTQVLILEADNAEKHGMSRAMKMIITSKLRRNGGTSTSLCGCAFTYLDPGIV